MHKYTIYEVADVLQVSHTTIYNKLNNKDIYKEMRNFITKQGKTRYIREDGLETLKKYVPLKENTSKVDSEKSDGNSDSILESVDTTTKETFQEINSKLIIELRERISSLENQLSVKDNQISSLLRQNENSQILLKHEQEKNKLMLESTEMKKPETIWSIFKRHKSI